MASSVFAIVVWLEVGGSGGAYQGHLLYTQLRAGLTQGNLPATLSLKNSLLCH